MSARRSGLVAALLTVSIGSATAGLKALPEIPMPALTAEQALAVAQRKVNSSAYVLVGLEWAKASEFQPRVSDGTDWHALDSIDEYSWFVTYVFRDERVAALHPEQPFNSVSVLRIKPDGTIGLLVGTR